MNENPIINEYTKQSKDELINLIKALCAIPSFSHHELKKAEFIQDWFKQYNIKTYIDEKYNVILPINDEGSNELVVFMAHIDTVFPDESGFECKEDGDYLYAPGVGDDTANVALLMLIARYLCLNAYTCDRGCLIVFNSCEEGLGNLDGSKYLHETYQGRIKECYSLDLGYDAIIAKAVGSIRYRITIKTEGGHSFSNFGNDNAIAIASKMISELYHYQVPKTSTSTYNVGVIEGGTSVNTIAQNVAFLFEYRSDSQKDLLKMKCDFEHFITKYQTMGYDINVEVIGERPSMGDVGEVRMHEIIDSVACIIEHYSHHKPTILSGSTDLNSSYSLGIPGCCFGGYLGKGEHTKEEYILISSLETGMKIVMHYMLQFFKKC